MKSEEKQIVGINIKRCIATRGGNATPSLPISLSQIV
jgi:hypothetical protein